jgi:hypothetical protein
MEASRHVAAGIQPAQGLSRRQSRPSAGRGDELWWGRHATPQPEHTPGRWYTVAVEEDAAAMTKLLLVSLVAKSCKVVVGLLVGEEEKQTQEFTMDTVPM